MINNNPGSLVALFLVGFPTWSDWYLVPGRTGGMKERESLVPRWLSWLRGRWGEGILLYDHEGSEALMHMLKKA